MIKRGEESALTSWYFEIDRNLFFSIIIMFFIGLWAMVSAGSVAAERLNPPQEWHFFLVKAIPIYVIGFITFSVSSFMNRRQIMIISALNVLICGLLLVATLIIPAAVKGSARWVNLGFASVMPSDLMKPGFILITAWFLTRLEKLSPGNIFTTKRVWKWDAWPAYLGVFLPMLFIIWNHPDFGSFILYLLVFGTMIFLAGLPMYLLSILFALCAGVGVFTFMSKAHVKSRILGFLGLAGGGDNYQIRKSVEAVQHGGLFGRAEDSFIKQSLPDAHTDFIFSAIAEDVGAILVSILLILFLYVLKQLMIHALNTKDKMVFYACSGLMVLFGVQVS